jgi:hypothetical protein
LASFSLQRLPGGALGSQCVSSGQHHVPQSTGALRGHVAGASYIEPLQSDPPQATGAATGVVAPSAGRASSSTGAGFGADGACRGDAAQATSSPEETVYNQVRGF